MGGTAGGFSMVNLHEPCRRQSGSFRAYFYTREEAERFANDPANHPVYLGDVAHLWGRCDVYHLSRPEWLLPEVTHQDAAILASVGVAVPEIVPGDLRR